VYVVLRPERIQAWRERNELSGRTLMRAGRWQPVGSVYIDTGGAAEEVTG
jgi:hypothetical protein